LPTINTDKFGEISYNKSDVVSFIRPILGFNDLQRYIIISRPESEPFKWLQSIDDPIACFVILEPILICPDYSVEISAFDIRQMQGSDNQNDYHVYGIVTVPRGHPEDMTINLQGPVIINSKNLNAVQLILNNPDYDIRYKIADNKITA